MPRHRSQRWTQRSGLCGRSAAGPADGVAAGFAGRDPLSRAPAACPVSAHDRAVHHVDAMTIR
ncbi:hypothetical protein SCANM63S_01294 [Streptomyces canarius]